MCSHTNVKVLVYKWNNVKQEIIGELRIARKELSVPPQEAAIKHGTNVPRFTWADYCSAIGVTKSTVNRWLVLPHVANNSGENEWYTPIDYINDAREVMGSIDVDPASSDIANEIVKATQYFTSTNRPRCKCAEVTNLGAILCRDRYQCEYRRT